MGPRLRDVAELAGVSVRTVSNVVTGTVPVAPDTRHRVQRAIDRLGYRPNIAARQLRRGRTGVIALVVPEIDSPYFGELAAALVRRARQQGLLVYIEQTDGEPALERAAVDGSTGQRVDGVVFSPWSLTPEALSDRAPDLPMVVLGEQPGAGHVDRVAVDNVAAARQATAHLLDGGRRRVVALGEQPHLRNRTAVQRLDGYRTAHRDAGATAADELRVPVQRLHRRDGWAAVGRLLDDGSTFDGIFAFTDQLALGAVRALADRGIRVPDDVAVVGFDDIEDGRYGTPTLTTVAPDKEQIADMALHRLLARIADPAVPPEDLVAGHRLIVRESSAVPADGPPRVRGS